MQHPLLNSPAEQMPNRAGRISGDFLRAAFGMTAGALLALGASTYMLEQKAKRDLEKLLATPRPEAPPLPQTLPQTVEVLPPLPKLPPFKLPPYHLDTLPEIGRENGPDVMAAQTIENRRYIAPAATLGKMQELATPMLQLAGRDILHAEPDSFQNFSRREWRTLIAPFSAFPDKALVESTYDELQIGATSVAGGKNFMAHVVGPREKLANSLCVVFGEDTLPARKIVAIMSNLPKSYISDALVAQFDARSAMAFIYLHEAAHCSQPDAKRQTKTSDAISVTLDREIDADRKAAAAYTKLAANDTTLDPDMPEKMRNLRLISAAMLSPNSDSFTLVFSMFDKTHATGANWTDANDTKPGAATPSQTQTLITFAAARAAYAMLSDAQRDKYAEAPKQLFARLISDGDTRTKDLLISTLLPYVTGAAAMAQDTEILVRTYQTLANTPLPADLPDNAETDILRQVQAGAQRFIGAWQKLGLALPEADSHNAFTNDTLWRNLLPKNKAAAGKTGATPAPAL